VFGGRGEDVVDRRGEFASFCIAEHPRLVGLLVLYCRDRELAHDLAQETLARLWRDRRKWDRIGSPRSYAAQTALNLAKNEFRRNAVRRRYQTLLDADKAQLHHDVDGAQSMAVRDAVAALPERKRRALILRYFADLSVEETAEVMNTPPNTVKSLTRRAIADLRAVLGVKDMEGQDDDNSDA
jgi:RNA polymerase sigma factor (sigma-70 family)